MTITRLKPLKQRSPGAGAAVADRPHLAPDLTAADSTKTPNRAGRLAVRAVVAVALGTGIAALAGASAAVALIAGAALLLATAAAGEFDAARRVNTGRLGRWLRIAQVGAMAHLMVVAIIALTGFSETAVVALAASWLLAPPAFLFTTDVALRGLLRPVALRTLVIGSGDVAARAIELARTHPELSIDPVAIADDPIPSRTDLPGLGLDELRETILTHRIEHVLVGFSRSVDRDLAERLRDLDDLDVHVSVIPRMFELLGPPDSQLALGCLGPLAVRRGRPSRTALMVKRAVDIGAVLLLAPLVLPVLAASIAAVVLASEGPAFFRQRRIGRDGRPFEILKLRTMVTDAQRWQEETVSELAVDAVDDAALAALLKPKDDPRVTPVGRFLRRSSLDELPQLWNVLRGDMSLVGPRPLQDYEYERLSSWQRRRQTMAPGITGLWQVLGRSDISWDERMQLDYAYVSNWSLSGDVSILARTVHAVSRAEGAV